MIIHRTTKFGRKSRCNLLTRMREHDGNSTPFRTTKPSPAEARRARHMARAKVMRSLKGQEDADLTTAYLLGRHDRRRSQ